MASGSDTPKRDPRLKKLRDNANLRKRAANGSDKGARKNAPKIRAMGNRITRRKLKVDPREAEDLEETADQANLYHQRKITHWGSDNAADRRTQHREASEHYQKVGGRREAQRIQRAELLSKLFPTDNSGDGA